MQTNLNIANSALFDINIEPIMSFDDPSKQARVIKNKFQIALDQLMTAHLWVCNRSFEYLNRGSDIDTFGWKYQYNLPLENLYTRAIIPADNIMELSAEVIKRFDVFGASTVQNEHYMLANNKIYTDAESVICVYSKRITDCNELSAYLIAPLTKLLAAEVAYPLTQDRQVRADQFGFYDDSFRKARSLNAKEDNPIVPVASSLTARV